MKFITIDGIDKSGKSTLISRLFKETNGKAFIIDRSPSGWHFFNELLGRSEDDKLYKAEYKNKLKQFRPLIDLSVLLEVDEDDWMKRCIVHSEQDLVGGLSFKEHQEEIHKYFDNAKYKNVLKLNTSNLTEDECLDLILKRIGIHRRK